MSRKALNLDIPDSGAVFGFGRQVPARFYIKHDSVVSAACGESHAAVVTSSGRLFTFGDNAYGQLGLGHMERQEKPTCVKSLKELGERAVRVTCGINHTLVTTESGRVFGFGANSDGQLTGDAEYYEKPVEIHQLKELGVKDLAAGRTFSLALSKQGDLYAWGNNGEGCLGQSDELSDSSEPLKVPIGEKVTSVSAGSYHCACVTASGRLLAWGETEGGKLGVDGAEEKERLASPTVVPLPDGQTARQVSCGHEHTLAVTAAGQVFACGSGECGQLGLGISCSHAPTMRRIEAFDGVEILSASAGERHSACVSRDAGLVFTFGDALDGKLGPSSRYGRTNQHRPFELKALRPVRVRRVVCGRQMSLVLALPRPKNDPAGRVSDGSSDEDDPLNSLAARSPRPLRRSRIGEGEGEKDGEGGGGGRLVRRRSTKSRERFRESTRLSRSLPTDAEEAFELVRPAHAEDVESDMVKPKTIGTSESQPPAFPRRTKPKKKQNQEEEEEEKQQHVMAVTKFDKAMDDAELSPESDQVEETLEKTDATKEELMVTTDPTNPKQDDREGEEGRHLQRQEVSPPASERSEPPRDSDEEANQVNSPHVANGDAQGEGEGEGNSDAVGGGGGCGGCRKKPSPTDGEGETRPTATAAGQGEGEGNSDPVGGGGGCGGCRKKPSPTAVTDGEGETQPTATTAGQGEGEGNSDPVGGGGGCGGRRNKSSPAKVTDGEANTGGEGEAGEAAAGQGEGDAQKKKSRSCDVL